MGLRKLDVTMNDQDYETLKKKLLETFSVQPTLVDPMVKSRVDWHCLDRSCFASVHNSHNTVFETREKWMRHHQRFHNRMCGSDRVYPKEIEAKQFIQERERRENARHGIAGAGGSAGRLMPPTVTPAGPNSRMSEAFHAIPLNSVAPSSSTSRALRAIPLNSAAPSPSTSGALGGASPNCAAPNSPRSRALRNSVSVRRSGPYRPRAIKAARPQEHSDQGFVRIAGDEQESSRTLDAAKREILMQRLSFNLQEVSRINTDSVNIMQVLGLPSTHYVSEIRRPNSGTREYPATTVATPVTRTTWVDWRARGLQAGHAKFVDPAHPNEGPAHVFETPQHAFEATPHPRQAAAHSDDGPVHVHEAIPYHPRQAPVHSNYGLAHVHEAIPYHPRQAPAHSNDGPARVYEAFPYHPRQAPVHSNDGPTRVYEAIPYHPTQAPINSNDGPAHVYEAIPYPSQALELSIGGPANSYQGPPLSIERPPHPHQAPALSTEGPTQLPLTFSTPSQSEEEKGEEENYKEASDCEELDSDNEDQPPIYRSQNVREGPHGHGWKDAKGEAHAAHFWPLEK